MDNKLAKFGLLFVAFLNLGLSATTFACSLLKDEKKVQTCNKYKSYANWISLILSLVLFGGLGLLIFPRNTFY